MNPELEALARRAVACKHWRWIEGMLTERGDRIASVEHDSLIVLDEEFEIVELTDGKAIPDLRDPATVGCLLALVREAWKNHTMSCFFDHADVAWSEYPWAVKLVGLRVVTGAYGQTEAAALVAALEAAP